MADQRITDNVFKVKAMPDWFSNATQVKDPKLSNTKIAAILKRDISQYSMNLIKSILENLPAPFGSSKKLD